MFFYFFICRNDILVTGVNRLGPSIRSGPAFCPRVSNGTEILNGNEILVSSGQRKSISVKVEHIPQFIIQSRLEAETITSQPASIQYHLILRFVCQFNIEGRVTSVNAHLLDAAIHCDELEFTYDSRTPKITASFSVIWNQSKPLDNPDNIHVVIYKCERMADNCESCLGIDQKYNCGWCQVCFVFLVKVETIPLWLVSETLDETFYTYTQGHTSWWPAGCKLLDEHARPLTC